MKYYCSKCFAKIEYKFNKPEICPFCGFSASAASKENPRNVSKEQFKNDKKLVSLSKDQKNNKNKLSLNSLNLDDEGDEFFEVDNIPFIKPGAGVVIEVEKSKKGVTFGELIDSSSDKKVEENDMSYFNGFSENNQVDEKTALEQFKKEASNREGFIDIS